MSIIKFPPPKRYFVEMQTDDDDLLIPILIECTGRESTCSIESTPWAGYDLTQIETWVFGGQYGAYTAVILSQMARAKSGESFFKNES